MLAEMERTSEGAELRKRGRSLSLPSSLPPCQRCYFGLQAIPRSFYLKTCFVAVVSLLLFYVFCFLNLSHILWMLHIFLAFKYSLYVLIAHIQQHFRIQNIIWNYQPVFLQILNIQSGVNPAVLTSESKLPLNLSARTEIFCWTSLQKAMLGPPAPELFMLHQYLSHCSTQRCYRYWNSLSSTFAAMSAHKSSSFGTVRQTKKSTGSCLKQ